MAKKQKSTADELWDIVGSLMALGTLFLIGYVFIKTNSWLLTGVALVVALILSRGVWFIRDFFHNERLKRSGITEIDKMDGDVFEEYLEQLFKAQGYKAIKTKASGDFGADVVIEKDNVRIVIQAKRKKDKVGLDAVQEVVAAKAYYKAQEAWVVTNSEYTPPAKKLAKSIGVKLFDREQLIGMILKVKNKA